jgi:hypothetical protein
MGVRMATATCSGTEVEVETSPAGGTADR